MVKQKEITISVSDLEAVMETTGVFARICTGEKRPLAPVDWEVMRTFRTDYAPILEKYKEVRSVKEILKRFETIVKEKYPEAY